MELKTIYDRALDTADMYDTIVRFIKNPVVWNSASGESVLQKDHYTLEDLKDSVIFNEAIKYVWPSITDFIEEHGNDDLEDVKRELVKVNNDLCKQLVEELSITKSI
jgi:hypothetical protein